MLNISKAEKTQFLAFFNLQFDTYTWYKLCIIGYKFPQHIRGKSWSLILNRAIIWWWRYTGLTLLCLLKEEGPVTCTFPFVPRHDPTPLFPSPDQLLGLPEGKVGWVSSTTWQTPSSECSCHCFHQQTSTRQPSGKEKLNVFGSWGSNRDGREKTVFLFQGSTEVFYLL